KLPHVGTTIFTVMTNRARELGAINLAQGFPDFDAPERLKDLVAYHVAAGHNQYAPMIGVPQLREQIAIKLAGSYGRMPDAEEEITITLGATEGIFSAVLALVHPGDEAILFDPSYDSYAPAVILAGGRPIHVPLQPPKFRIDWTRVKDLINAKTRLGMINTPHDPVATVLSSQDPEIRAEPWRSTAVVVQRDASYGLRVFGVARHGGILTPAEPAAGGGAVAALGTPMHAAGWCVGYTLAAAHIAREVRRVLHFNTFRIAAPLQH